MNTAVANSSAGPLIELVDAGISSAQAHEVPLLTGVNWQLRAGGYWAIGGLHWAGKSDWLLTVAGLQRPLTGAHWLFGQETSTLTELELLAARLRVGLVFEHGGRLFTDLSVADNVALPLRYHRNCRRAEAEEAVGLVLQLAGLTELAEQVTGQLNRSWRQRVALARALILQPEVLLLDNPLAGLDPRQTRWWLDTLDQLNAGHPGLAGRPVALVATTDDFRPWSTRARDFALLQDRHWLPLGGRAELAASVDPSLHDLLAL